MTGPRSCRTRNVNKRGEAGISNSDFAWMESPPACNCSSSSPMLRMRLFISTTNHLGVSPANNNMKSGRRSVGENDPHTSQSTAMMSGRRFWVTTLPRKWNGHPGSRSPFAPSLLLEREPLFIVDALCALVIDHQAFSFQHDVQPGTAKTLPLEDPASCTLSAAHLSSIPRDCQNASPTLPAHAFRGAEHHHYLASTCTGRPRHPLADKPSLYFPFYRRTLLAAATVFGGKVNGPILWLPTAPPC